MRSRAIDLTGQSFGRLVVLRRAKTVRQRARWVCRCACGIIAIVRAADLRSGNSQACDGCRKLALVKRLRRENLGRYGAVRQIERLGYSGVHIRLRGSLPQVCADCGKPGRVDAALRVDADPAFLKISRAGVLYSVDLDAYRPLCRRCHVHHDRLFAVDFAALRATLAANVQGDFLKAAA